MSGTGDFNPARCGFDTDLETLQLNGGEEEMESYFAAGHDRKTEDESDEAAALLEQRPPNPVASELDHSNSSFFLRALDSQSQVASVAKKRKPMEGDRMDEDEGPLRNCAELERAAGRVNFVSTSPRISPTPSLPLLPLPQ